VQCLQRGAPTLENVEASGPTLEKASGERRGGIYRGSRWHGAAVKNAIMGKRHGLEIQHPTIVFLIEKHGPIGPVRYTGLKSSPPDGRASYREHFRT
jgi:hypothetical protein